MQCTAAGLSESVGSTDAVLECQMLKACNESAAIVAEMLQHVLPGKRLIWSDCLLIMDMPHAGDSATSNLPTQSCSLVELPLCLD